jgi:serine/threonine protein kinase
MENNAGSNLNKVKKRLLSLSPTVAAGLERECNKSDFFREGDKAVGVGGFGEVWKVIHKATNKLYVIKVIDKKNIVKQKMVEQMNREIEIMYKVNHPHVVKLINHFEDDDKFYLIMLFASKGQLYSHLKRETRFDQRKAAQIMRETLEAVKYLHSFDPPIIHRDIKPENLLLDENSRVKLADFGWSNFKSDDQTRVTYCGTPEYLSPEMVKKQGHDTTVDIWSLGVLLFELLAGHAPFTGSSQEELFQNIRKLKINWPADFPPLAKNLVTKILKLNPSERISIDEILNHAWFEKNPPLKPVLVNTIIDPHDILLSHLISGDANLVKEKLQGETKSEKAKVVSITRASKAETNKMNVDNSLLFNLQLENEILNKEVLQYKTKLERLETEYKLLKIDFGKIKEQANHSSSLQQEISKLNEEIEKYKILNRDRLDMLREIEEKNNEVFELRNKIKNYESESQNSNRSQKNLEEKITEQTKQNIIFENKISEYKSKLNEIIKEKEDASMDYQKKLEILQNRILDEGRDTDVPKVIEMLNDSLEDMKQIFKSKMSNLLDFIEDKRDDMKTSESVLIVSVKEKSEAVFEVLTKLKSNMDDSITSAKLKIQKEMPSKSQETIDWLKKQINELQPFKKDYTYLIDRTKQLDMNIKVLQEKLQSSEDLVSSLMKMVELKESKLDECHVYSENLEAKLSDVKDFVFKNCPEQLDSFNAFFKNYYTK